MWEYVLSQVLAINPQNENAIKRLQKWQQEKAGVQEEEEETDAESDIEPAEALDEETFEEQAEEVEDPEVDDEVSKRLDNYGVEDVRREITQQRDEYLKSVPENFMDGEDFTDRKKRSPLLIVFLVLVVLGAVFAGLYFFTDIFKPAETPITEASPTFEIVEEETPTATVILPTKTATLVPSPTATLQPTSTHTPTSTPTTVIFPTPVIALSDILTELDSQVLGFREFESPIVPEKYVLSQYDALNYFNAYEIDVNVEEHLDLTQKVLVVLNLVSEDYDMLTSYYNRLGLLSSVNNSDLNRITVFGIPFGIEQQFSYVYSFFAAQLTSMVEESTGITPGICFWLDQECQAITGLVWGDAFFSSELWAETYLTDEDKASISRIDRRDTILLDLNTPNSLFTDAQFGFDYGRLFAQDLYNISLWWTQLEGAYQTTPTTTEQLMHLNKYLSEEEPVEILDQDLTEALEFEWEELWSGSLGEWYTFLLMRHSEDAAYDLSDADFG